MTEYREALEHLATNSKYSIILEEAIDRLERYDEAISQNVFDSEQVGLAIIDDLINKYNKARTKAAAFDVINNKVTDIDAIRLARTVDEYNLKENGFTPLTNYEFQLLKGTLSPKSTTDKILETIKTKTKTIEEVIADLSPKQYKLLMELIKPEY